LNPDVTGNSPQFTVLRRENYTAPYIGIEVTFGARVLDQPLHARKAKGSSGWWILRRGTCLFMLSASKILKKIIIAISAELCGLKRLQKAKTLQFAARWHLCLWFIIQRGRSPGGCDASRAFVGRK
jgi:hypothetical protein